MKAARCFQPGNRKRTRLHCPVCRKLGEKRGALGVDQILAITAAVIVVGLVLIPGLRDFGETIIAQLETWWTNISATIFAST
ncbi:MAG TPA: hypothetical protein DD727_07300 [Clostridiales bacterium]|nr:hypothetical protein [Clostridiales bacterium]